MMTVEAKKVHLDTLCLKSERGLVEMLERPAYLDALEQIAIQKKEQESRFNDFIDRVCDKDLDSDTLKKLVKFQRAYAPSKSMRTCNTTPIVNLQKDSDTPIPLEMRVNEYGYSMRGLNRCKNGFCPLCVKAKAGERAHRIKDGIQAAQIKNHAIYFVTLTLPRAASIEFQVSEIRRRWKRLNNLFQSFRSAGNVYTARALDVTFNPYHKASRYHVHVHAIVITETEIEDIERRIVDTWIAANTKDARCSYKAQRVDRVRNTGKDAARVGKYVAKMAGLANEITQGQAKRAKGTQSVTLRDLMLQQKPNGTKLKRARCVEIYNEFLAGMHRVRTIDVSRNWDDLTKDIEAAEEEEAREYTIEIDPQKWALIKNDWFYIAEKVQFEIFTRGYHAGGAVDKSRVNEVLEAAQILVNEIQDTSEIEFFLLTEF